jgi:hypothetical protein
MAYPFSNPCGNPIRYEILYSASGPEGVPARAVLVGTGTLRAPRGTLTSAKPPHCRALNSPPGCVGRPGVGR